ncbi:MAG: hypothetical protein N2Z58_08435 [Fervidobacterium sp.]|nr:hypothetical protein [Fervidobacterium sp.]
MDNTALVLIALAIAIGIVGLFFLMQPKEQWIQADGLNVWKIPSNSEILEINIAKSSSVKKLKESNKLMAFQGEHVGSGAVQDKEVAKIRAYQQLAELLNAKISTFAQVVEGQIQSLQTNADKQQLKSASLSAYKRITELLAQARVSGAYVYAVWRIKEGNNYRTYVLLVYDPEDVKKFLQIQPDVNQTINELGSIGIDFFGALNSVIDEAIRGTPLTSNITEQAQQTPSSQSSQTQSPQLTQQIQPVQQSLQPGVKYMKGIGEAYGKTELEAEELAKKNALANLSEQLYVDVQAITRLKDQFMQVVIGNEAKGKLQTEYQKTIETRSQFEFVDVIYRTLDKKATGGKYYAKVEANVEEENAKMTFETYISLKLASTLTDGKLPFSAKKILDRYEPMVSKYKFPPKISQEIAAYISKVKSRYNEVDVTIKDINSRKVFDTKSAIEVAQLINMLDIIASDLPDGIINREQLRPFLKEITIDIAGPNELIIGEQATLQIKTNNSQVTLLRVINNKVDGQELVSLKDGNAALSGVIKGLDPKITLSLGGIVNATWAPGKILVNPDFLRVTYKDKDTIRIIAGGTSKPSGDQKLTHEKAVKDALIKIVRKVAAEVLIGQDRDLLDVPIDDYIINKVISSTDYEITATGEYQGLYYTVVSCTVDKKRFEEDIKDALKKAPTGFALLIVEGDTLGYIEPTITSKLVNSGIKLVSKDFSKKLLEEQQRLGYNITTFGKLSALSAARYVLYTKANVTSTWLNDYNIYSVRILVTTQVIDTITGNILSAPQFEDVNSGATVQAAVSKIVSSQKFLDYTQQIVNTLNFENVEIKKVYKYIFILERAAYGSMLMDYLNAKFDGIKILEKVDTRLVIETNVTPSELENSMKAIDTLKIKKISDDTYQVTR